MSERPKYGDQDPGSPFDAESIFSRAMEEFLWCNDKMTKERVRITGAASFGLWCSWWRRALCGCRDVEALPELSSFIGEGIKRRCADSLAELEDLGVLLRRWREAWEVMLDRGSEKPQARPRAAKRGMKFCLIVLVLRYGLASGSIKKAGKRKMPDGQDAERYIDVGLSWLEAKEAASLLLALSVLTREGETKSLPRISDDEVEHRGAMMGSESGRRMAGMLYAVDLNEFKKLGVGLAVFKKRLRVTAPDDYEKVKSLAADYYRRVGDLWAKGERLDRWFPR